MGDVCKILTWNSGNLVQCQALPWPAGWLITGTSLVLPLFPYLHSRTKDGDFFRNWLISCPETVFDSNESNVCPRKPALHKTCPEPSSSSVHYSFCQESPEYTVRLLGTDLRSQPSFSKGPINHMMLSEKDYSKQMLSPPDLSIEVSQKDLQLTLEVSAA